ncbi:DUF2278 family protein [Leptothrix ochracea]|uniref:DUF2278 family protein n=5 Tax=Leptothrix ochracea TaxID=735331 RepID=UPI0034E24138
MPLSTYGVIKGTAIGHLRDADDDHYQIMLRAAGVMHRVAVNVRSSAPNAPSTVLFRCTTVLPASFTTALQALPAGAKKLPHKAGGLAIDYLRSDFVSPKLMRPLAPDVPGANNDLKDQLETATLKAMAQPGAMVYAFGAKWGPEKGKPDTYFHFTPGNGIHDIHMNQGNSGSFAADNGPWQDGALILEYPGNKWSAFFFAFQSQSFKTDATGNPV